MSNKQTKRGVTPKLRFPEFRASGEWKKTRLEDALSPIVRERKKPINPYTGLGVRSHGKGTFLKNLELPEKNSMEYLYEVQSDDLIVNITFAWEGAIAIVQKADSGALVSHRFPTYTFKRNVAIPEFFQYIILDKLFVYELGVISPGGAGRNRVLNRNDFLKLSVLLPDIAEQRKIAECLTSLDELIAAHSQKLDALKAHKKGLLQHLFPAEGETVPRLRFPEFQASGEWERKQLSELLFETKQRNNELEYGRQDVLSVSGEYGCVNQIEFLGRSYAGASLKNYHVVETGDIVYTKSPLKKNPFGIIKENKGKPGIVSTLYAVYRVTDIGHPAYLDHYFSRDYNLNSYLQPIVKKGAKNDMKVNNFAVLGGEILIPKIDEQRKIAACLSALDEQIAAQSQKIDALNAHKKGLLQQLFPSPEGVGG